jgi:hypothetical protein
VASIRDIRIQKLFLVTIILKVGSSFLGWYLQLQWSLGFLAPLAFMGAYVLIGWKRSDKDVSDEKFADSCYYLGFIFTISSIIFSLFDLPQIGTKIQDIAVRFGAAMVSTVIGLVVRVYLVSFKQDANDALRDVEDAVIDASKRLRDQLVMAGDKLNDFQVQVDLAAQGTVERVNMQVERLSQDHANKLTTFFADLTTRNQDAFTRALEEVTAASNRLSVSVDGYSLGMRSNLESIENKVGAFSDAVTQRLAATTFPDDYFSKRMSQPLDQLNAAAGSLASQVHSVSQEVRESVTVLSAAFRKLKTKATATEESMDSVVRLTAQQQAVLDSAQGQLTTLEKLAQTLHSFDSLLEQTAAGITASSLATSALSGRVEAVVNESGESRKALNASLSDVVSKLAANASATASVSATNERVASELGAATATASSLVRRLERDASVDQDAAKHLAGIDSKAEAIVARADAAIQQIQSVGQRIASLDAVMRSQGAELKQLMDKIRGVRPANPASTQPTTVGTVQPTVTPQVPPTTSIGQSPLGAPSHVAATGMSGSAVAAVSMPTPPIGQPVLRLALPVAPPRPPTAAAPPPEGRPSPAQGAQPPTTAPAPVGMPSASTPSPLFPLGATPSAEGVRPVEPPKPPGTGI